MSDGELGAALQGGRVLTLVDEDGVVARVWGEADGDVVLSLPRHTHVSLEVVERLLARAAGALRDDLAGARTRPSSVVALSTLGPVLTATAAPVPA